MNVVILVECINLLFSPAMPGALVFLVDVAEGALHGRQVVQHLVPLLAHPVLLNLQHNLVTFTLLIPYVVWLVGVMFISSEKCIYFIDERDAYFRSKAKRAIAGKYPPEGFSLD